MRSVGLGIAVAVFCLAGGRVALACETSDKAAFQDTFDTLDPTWGEYDNYKAAGGKLVISPPKGFNTSTINTASLYEDVDICVEVTVPAPVLNDNCASIVFWAVDYDNYYSFQVSSGGSASFWRRQRGKWLNQVNWQPAKGVKKGKGQTNELRVITEGDKATLSINGTLFKEVKGKPPEDGQQIGLLACSPNSAAGSVAFDNIVVTEPEN